RPALARADGARRTAAGGLARSARARGAAPPAALPLPARLRRLRRPPHHPHRPLRRLSLRPRRPIPRAAGDPGAGRTVAADLDAAVRSPAPVHNERPQIAMNGNVDIFEEVVRLRREGIPAALATIVGTRGSTPGRTSMRLLVLADGTFLGTVGGGCLEAEVYDQAKQVIADEQPRTLTFRLTERDSPDSGLMCGGEVT